MSQIDIAGASAAVSVAKGRVATVAVSQLRFIAPLYIYDLVSFYADVVRVGNTSITVEIEVYAQRQRRMDLPYIKIADAVYVYVAVEQPGKKRKITNN
jgi:acyl-CoA thioesterase YciA